VLAGHYAPAFLGKAGAREAPLWALLLAAQLVDVVHMILLLLGLERTTLDPTLPSNPLVIEHVPYTHSLLASVGWAILVYLVAWKWLGSRRAAVVLALVTVSHWFLDLIVHRPDLTLYGVAPKLGLGLWNHPALAHAVELAVLGVSVAVYWWRVRPRPRVLAVIGVLALVQIFAIVGPPPTQVPVLAVSALGFFALASAIAAWADR
jgi:hypothetical protein